MKKDFVIIGGGVAGLCAAIRLTELGAAPLIIEAGEYPCHKVCGEFFSPAAIPTLKQWGIHPIEIKQSRFHTETKTLDFSFPISAGSLSHVQVDPKLAEIAIANGAEILTKTKVAQLRSHSKFHEIELSTGEIVQANNLILAAGRIPQNVHLASVASVSMPYIGIKAHFEGIPLNDTLEMFAFKGAYIGISPIENNRCNVACLVCKGIFNQWRSADAFIEYLKSKNKLLDFYLSNGKSLFSEWMSVPVPAFGVKKTPNWPHSYFIGDAAGAIPPATGNGLSMAIKGGILAAEYAIKKDAKGFKSRWKREFSSPIFWGKFLHTASLQPFLTEKMITLGNTFPFLKERVYNLTH